MHKFKSLKHIKIVLVQQVCAAMHKHEYKAFETHYQQYKHIIWTVKTVYSINLNDCTLLLELVCDNCATCRSHERLFMTLQPPSEAIEQKSAVNLPFLTLIKLIKVFLNNWFILKSIHFYRHFKRGTPVSRRFEKGSIKRDLILKRVYSTGKILKKCRHYL